MLSATWAFGPPMDMKVAAHGPIENKWFAPDFRRSAAKHLLFPPKTNRKQILRFAQDDTIGAFSAGC
jgi:hypothetical protein